MVPSLHVIEQRSPRTVRSFWPKVQKSTPSRCLYGVVVEDDTPPVTKNAACGDLHVTTKNIWIFRSDGTWQKWIPTAPFGVVHGILGGKLYVAPCKVQGIQLVASETAHASIVEEVKKELRLADAAEMLPKMRELLIQALGENGSDDATSNHDTSSLSSQDVTPPVRVSRRIQKAKESATAGTGMEVVKTSKTDKEKRKADVLTAPARLSIGATATSTIGGDSSGQPKRRKILSSTMTPTNSSNLEKDVSEKGCRKQPETSGRYIYLALPSTQRVAQIRTFGEPLSILTAHPVPDPSQLQPNECLVKIEYAGVCQSDLHARNGDWARKPTLPRIGGHEGVGTVIAVGAGTVASAVSAGDRVGLKWIAQTCLNCDHCRSGNESMCSAQLVHGFTADGTFAQYTIGWTNYVTPIPGNLDAAAATSILCAGVTVYKGLKRIDAASGSWIAISGAGGGLGHLAIQYAIAMGYRVVAIDSGEEKRKLCLSLGAEKWVDFKESGEALVRDVVAATDGVGPHAALVSAGVAAPYMQACYYVRKTGTIMCLGLPPSQQLQVPFEVLVGKELKVIGSVTGSRQDAIEALNLAALGKVQCRYTLRRLDELETIFEEMKRGEISGRVVLRI